MRISRQLVATAATLAVVLSATACTGGTGGLARDAIGNGDSNTAVPTGHLQRGGTVTIAEVAVSPNFIFPLAPATNQNGYNGNLAAPMWPCLVYSGDRAKSIVNPQESLLASIRYSDGGKTVTIGLKHWNWSDGKPVTSRDFVFVYNLLKANAANWVGYVPGLFPSDVVHVSTPGAHTVVLGLSRSYNQAFFTDDVLSVIPLLPQHAWDRTSASGPAGNYDLTTAGSKAVFSFLQKEGGQMSTFATNPLWKVVDGPWTLSAFQSNGYYSYVPNKRYSGPDKPILSKVVVTPFTTDTAELDALRAGNTLDVGGLPLNDINQAGVLRSSGYSVVSQPIPGVAEIVPNLYNASVGPVLRQLYVRQALEDLINRPQIVAKVYAGYADPGNGPVPLQAGGPWVSPLEKSGGPYPYSPAAATALLRAHGWQVVPGGTSTCQRPGTGASGCGAGVTAGEPLSFQLAYSSGAASMDEQNAAIQSSEAQAGVRLTLKPEPFNTLIATVGDCSAATHPAAAHPAAAHPAAAQSASACGWQLVDFGYDQYSLYPAGDGYFDTGGSGNEGGYSSPEMNRLIDATEYGSSTKVFFAYEDYAARQLPWLWLPNQESILVYKSTLQGVTPLNPFSGGLNPEVWYYSP
jgi:peptide/nickel transport system substrate-binding protein